MKLHVLVAVLIVAGISIARAQDAPTPAETTCMQNAAGSIVTIMRLQNAVAARDAEIAKLKDANEKAP